MLPPAVFHYVLEILAAVITCIGLWISLDLVYMALEDLEEKFKRGDNGSTK